MKPYSDYPNVRWFLRDYPHVHWFLAGDASENSLPADAYNIIAGVQVHPDDQPVFEAAEQFLESTGLSSEQLFKAGYETGCGMCVDDENKCIGDCSPEEIEAEWMKLYTKWGVGDRCMLHLIDTLY